VTDPAKGNQVRHSVTALKQFEFCERQFYFQRILGLPERPGPQLAVGIAYHAAIEVMLFKEIVGLEWARDTAAAGLAQAMSEKGWCDPGVSEAELLDEISAALRRLQPIIKMLPPVVREGKPLIEVWCERFTGKVDLVSSRTPTCEGGQIISTADELCVVDWKTTAKPRGGGKFQKDHSQQLALYCLEFGCKNGCIVEIPRDVRMDIHVDVIRFDDYELARWAKFFEAQFAAMSSRGSDEAQYKLAPRGHGLCCPTYCAYWDRCPGGAG
jgi:hypothetical protein